MNRKNGHNFTRSASVPDTMEAVEPTKTIWKNQWDMVEWPCAVTPGAVDASPAKSALSCMVEP